MLPLIHIVRPYMGLPSSSSAVLHRQDHHLSEDCCCQSHFLRCSFALHRLYVIHRCKKLKQLDFRKVKQKEREEAAQVFASAQQPADASGQAKASTFEPDEELAQAEAAAAAATQQQVGACLVSLAPESRTDSCACQYPWQCCKGQRACFLADRNRVLSLAGMDVSMC